jgi:ribonuclease H / adenosylcobalamin/alpha-ribazole phosphatase
MRAITHIDGGCRPTNPGHAGFAIVINLEGEEFILSRYIGWRTNNVAEFMALVVAVKYARHLGASQLEILSDSKLVVQQTHGRWRSLSDDLRPLCVEARRLLDKYFPNAWSLDWFARANNSKADYYCGMAIQAGRFKNPWVRKHLKKQEPGQIIDPFAHTR